MRWHCMVASTSPTEPLGPPSSVTTISYVSPFRPANRPRLSPSSVISASNTSRVVVVLRIIAMSMSVCLSVRLSARITRQQHDRTSPNFVHVACGCGSVLLWRRCDTLSSSGFVDDVMFFIQGGSGPEWKHDVIFQRRSLGGGTNWTSGNYTMRHRGRSQLSTIALVFWLSASLDSTPNKLTQQTRNWHFSLENTWTNAGNSHGRSWHQTTIAGTSGYRIPSCTPMDAFNWHGMTSY